MPGARQKFRQHAILFYQSFLAYNRRTFLGISCLGDKPMSIRILWAVAAFCWAISSAVLAAGPYYEVKYEASTAEGELQMPVTYTVWLPPEVKTLRGVIVHQHGCGTGACQGGATAAYDLHWQELARRYDCALLGPSYGQEENKTAASGAIRAMDPTKNIPAARSMTSRGNRSIPNSPRCRGACGGTPAAGFGRAS